MLVECICVLVLEKREKKNVVVIDRNVVKVYVVGNAKRIPVYRPLRPSFLIVNLAQSTGPLYMLTGLPPSAWSRCLITWGPRCVFTRSRWISQKKNTYFQRKCHTQRKHCTNGSCYSSKEWMIWFFHIFLVFTDRVSSSQWTVDVFSCVLCVLWNTLYYSNLNSNHGWWDPKIGHDDS